LNVPPVLASNFILGGDRAYTRDVPAGRQKQAEFRCHRCHHLKGSRSAPVITAALYVTVLGSARP
jgi:hypothetical protein